MNFAIPTIFTTYHTHELTIPEAEYVIRENLNLMEGWTPPVDVIVSLRDQDYIVEGGLSDKSVDFFDAYNKLDLQTQIQIWAIITFGSADIMNKQERAYRFCEEALELVQSSGVSREDLHTLVDYVFNRPVGDMPQEVGGVFTTLAVLCSVNDHAMMDCAKKEVKRIWSRIDEIREKQKNKPKASPLQGQPSTIIDFKEKIIRQETREEQQVAAYAKEYGSTNSQSEPVTKTEDSQIALFRARVIEIVTERHFISMTSLIAMLAKEWVYILDFDVVKFIKAMIATEEIRSFEYYHENNPYNYLTMLCAKDIVLNIDHDLVEDMHV